MNDEIKISDEARECGEAIGTMLKNGYSLYPAMQRIQLLLNKRDAEIAELRGLLAFAECDLAHDLDETGCCVRGCESCKSIQANPVWRKWKADPNFKLLDAAMSKETKGEQQ